MVKRVWEQVLKYRMIEENDRVIAGISGGADSVCLLFILLELKRRLPFKFYAIHVEHAVRGEASLEDARFVEGLCQEQGVDFQCIHADVPAIAKERRLSIEEAGRMVRYEAFADAAKRLGGAKIAVAHNQNDNAETMLFHLFRGTGLRGLCGIPPVRDNIIRPLLVLSRKEIEEYLHGNGIQYRTDATNESTDYTRNRLRLHILPLAEQEINRRAVYHLSESAELLRETEDYLEAEAAKLYGACVTDCAGSAEESVGPISQQEAGISIYLPEFNAAAPIVRRYVLRMCAQRLTATGLKDMTKGHMDALLRLCESGTGKKAVLPGGLTAVCSYERLIISRSPCKNKSKEKSTEAAVLFEPETGSINEVELAGFRFSGYIEEKKEKIPEKTYTKWFDCDIIKNTVQIRTRRPGDYLTIDARGGRQKLKSWLINEKFPREIRDRLLVVASGSHVLWVVGHRMGESHKVSERTKRLLVIHAEKTISDKGE